MDANYLYAYYRMVEMLDADIGRILDALQRDGALSAADVASRVGLSTTTCWRRIQQLEQDGVIKKRVALLDRELDRETVGRHRAVAGHRQLGARRHRLRRVQADDRSRCPVRWMAR